ncbi:MAG: rRNA biogenesis protein rrp5 [Prevotella sp.]
MSRIKLLLDVENDMRSLADSIQAVCDAMASDGQPDTDKPQDERQKKPSKSKAEIALAITLEQVRGVLADKSRNGHTAEVRAIIQKYGADRLSDIDPKDYPAVLQMQICCDG